MKLKTHSFLGLTLVVGVSLQHLGCLKTRSEVKEADQRQVISQQVVSLQKENADVNARFAELNEELRALRGRVEVAENKAQQGSQQSVTEAQEASRKAALLQETLTKLDAQTQAQNAEILALRAELSSLRAQRAAEDAAKVGTGAASTPKSKYESGLEHFQQKDWKKAILAFQEFREKNSKSEKWPTATYLIGVSFQELGMKDEAKTFFEEVITRSPQSKDAAKAKSRLKSISKK